MSLESNYRERVSELERECRRMERNLGTKSSKLKFGFVVSIPLIIGVVLYYFKPRFVLEKDDYSITPQRDGGKVFMWTVILSIVVWCGMFLYRKYYLGRCDTYSL